MNQPLTVHGLVCHSHVNLAILCFQSLRQFSIDPVQVTLHDDGSLTAADQDRLRQYIPDVTLIDRIQANELIYPLLQNYPVTAQFRREVPHAIKLLDIALLNQGDIAYCDSDLLFFRPFSGLFHFPEASVSALFMQDYLEAYSILPWNLLRSRQLRLPSKVNSGLIFMRRDAYDLDFIEWFLSQPAHRSKPLHKMEQTCWAAMGYRAGCRIWHAQQIALIRPNTSLTHHTVAGHFVKEVRYRHPEFVAMLDRNLVLDPVSIQTIPAEDCKLSGLMKNHFKRNLNRVLSYRKKILKILK